MADEHGLTTGWEPIDELDVADTVLRQQIHNLAARYRYSGERTAKPVLDDVDLVGVQMSEGTPWGNDVVLLRPLRPDGVDALLDRLRAFARSPSHVWSAWPTPDLSPHGFHLMGHPPSMVRAPGGDPPPAPQSLEIVEAASDELMDAYDRTGVAGFPINRPDGTPVERLLTPDLRGGPWRFFVGFSDGHPVTVASAFVGCDVVQVEFVATLDAHRGRGYGEAMTWAATLVEPDLPAVLLASDDGRPVYERMGYLAVQRFTLWYWPGTGR